MVPLDYGHAISLIGSEMSKPTSEVEDVEPIVLLPLVVFMSVINLADFSVVRLLLYASCCSRRTFIAWLGLQDFFESDAIQGCHIVDICEVAAVVAISMVIINEIFPQFLKNQHTHLDFIVINAANFVIKDLHSVNSFQVTKSAAYL